MKVHHESYGTRRITWTLSDTEVYQAIRQYVAMQSLTWQKMAERDNVTVTVEVDEMDVPSATIVWTNSEPPRAVDA